MKVRTCHTSDRSGSPLSRPQGCKKTQPLQISIQPAAPMGSEQAEQAPAGGVGKPPKLTLASLAAVVEAQRAEIVALQARVATLEGGGVGGVGGGAVGAGQAGEAAAGNAAAGSGGQVENAAPRERPAKKARKDKAGESFITSIRPASNRQTVSARTIAHSPQFAFECTFSVLPHFALECTSKVS